MDNSEVAYMRFGPPCLSADVTQT